ncbi:hypothetical protein, partial [Methyloglobulus sp.]|uniref:hypothetical protein n=1 Tax=Methyloglobulus sp. TaxID=2518622 RepID=UPI003988D9D0
MKIKKEEARTTARNKYTAQFKGQAPGRADRDGVPKAAQDLGIAERCGVPGGQNVARLDGP